MILPLVAGLASGVALIAILSSTFGAQPYSQVNRSITESTSIYGVECDRPASQIPAQEIRERTWIAVSRIGDDDYVKSIASDKNCIAVTEDLLIDVPSIKKAIIGADGCAEGTEVCQVSHGMSLAGDEASFELTISEEEARALTDRIPLKTNAAVLFLGDRSYLLQFYTSDEPGGAQMETEFAEDVSWHPVEIREGETLAYTLLLKTWATYGAPAVVDLKAAVISDSGLAIRIEPDRLVIPERSEAQAKLFITAQDARPGIYETRIMGRINDSDLLFGPCGLGGQCPVVQVGSSGWKIQDYGLGQGLGIGGQFPPETLKVEVATDKQEYAPGEPVIIQAFVVNDGQERRVIDSGARLITRVADPEGKIGSGYVYTIDAIYDSNEPIVIEPKSRLLLVRPFQWDQKTFDFDLKPSAVQEGTYSVSAGFSGIGSYVLHDRTEISIGDVQPKQQDDFAGFTITIPQGVYENTGGPSFEPGVATIPAGTPFRWQNLDFVLHTATSGTPSSDDRGLIFDTGFVSQGEFSKALTLDEPGEYPYFCQLHPWMAGTVVIE